MQSTQEPGSFLTAGIDIGGTKMAVALMDQHGRVRARQIIPTEAELGFDRAVERLAACLKSLQSQAGNGTLSGIGIGCAGPIDSRRGLINNPYTLTGWDRCNIVQPLQEQFQVPVFLENDADAAAFGECSQGAGAGFDPVVMLTFGTGIGGAVVCGGRLYRGVNGEHPELGHLLVTPGKGPDCYCGTSGCLESIASGTALAAAGQALGLNSARELFAAAHQGHREAQEIIGRATGASARAAWTLCHTFLPQRLVLGGGMMDQHFGLFSEAILEGLRPATQFPRTAVSVVKATLGNDAGVVGAAAIARQRVTADHPAPCSSVQARIP